MRVLYPNYTAQPPLALSSTKNDDHNLNGANNLNFQRSVLVTRDPGTCQTTGELSRIPDCQWYWPWGPSAAGSLALVNNDSGDIKYSRRWVRY